VQFAELFAGDIDFRRALRKGDRFQMVYETLQADGETLRTGQLLSAEFINAGKLHQAMWFQDAGSKGQYYSLEGLSLRKAFLTSPLKYTRVSSGFGIRVHPISKDKRAHKGIDYAAPTGTPVRTVGDGVIAFAGVQRGYGNVIEVAHRNNKTTVFAHLSRIDVKKGQKVEQGAVIGAVGSTGFSTGPHLHFEFRVDGEHQDPLTIANERNTQPISAAAKPAFDKAASLLKLQLKDAATIVQARAQ
jgi:murein DD-endopeptidase MepM/ murein hydrolase activator NlpD